MWHKIRNVLILKRIPHAMVPVADMPPRPALQRLGVTYRRIPVMAIGNDLFFDTSLMVSELEKRFTPENGHPALLDVHRGIQEIASAFWSDRILFPITGSLLPQKKLSEAFIKDRTQYNPNARMDKLDALRPAGLSALQSHLKFLAKQLSTSSTPFLLGTQSPSYIDVSFFTVVIWAKSLRTADDIPILPSSKAPPPYRRVMEWVEAVDATIKAEAGNPASKTETLDDGKAAELIFSSAPTSLNVGVDKLNPMVKAGWLAEGDLVSVTPTDTGRIPQYGTLVGLSDDIIALRVQAPSGDKSLVGHFPAIGYSVKKNKLESTRL